ncbi:glycosyltransferase family protein [Gephyromycinifex aptenodytis]|uniref:hypothetical protein n=1 Tax=Gephyromycinifex aptenodytis TaxID=2716227 RepID=UPI001447EA90|nr:hypothetical protein [Gephyromycinifex aptenodytis]
MKTLGPIVSEVRVLAVDADEPLMEFARRSGAQVESIPDDGDVAAAWNHITEVAQAPWVLLLNGDERVSGDADRLARLLDTTPGAAIRPDALELVCRNGEREEREARLFRPETARFTGRLTPRLVSRGAVRELRRLTPGADVLALVAAAESADEPTRWRRREARARRVLESLDAQRVGGDDLVGALIERARARRGLGDANGALADLNRARREPASERYRWQAREELAALLIEHRHLTGAETLIRELRTSGADEGYSDWLQAQVHAAQGQATDALRILAGIAQATRADGQAITTPEILTETMILAARIHDYDRALECCIELCTTHGLVLRYGRLLLKLWGVRSPGALADRLLAAPSSDAHQLAQAFQKMPQPGPSLAEHLLGAQERAGASTG